MGSYELGTRTGRKGFRDRLRIPPDRSEPSDLHEHSDSGHDQDRGKGREDRRSPTVARRQGHSYFFPLIGL